MTKQSEVFLEGEGDAWHERNRRANRKEKDYLMEALLDLEVNPREVLEYGCGTGHRLESIRLEFGSKCLGIDPSELAIQYGTMSFPKLDLIVGTTDHVPLEQHIDLIIFGFCLYLVDREDLFYIVGMNDSILEEGGYLAIHDFDPEFPQVRPYHHKEGVFSYKMDHAKLWLANPAYELVHKVRITEEESITILRKNSWEQFK